MQAEKQNEQETKVKKDGDGGVFIPPDGGWGWMVVFAAGFSNLSALPVLQQFGLLFRDRFANLGISSSEITTIINMNSALTSCVGLANGPVFRKFTYRQVSLTGAIVIVVALLLTTFSFNFATYFISFSVLYGAGFGISSSANALALNTYWKKRRRIATGLSWTTTGLGPIVWPHIITALFALYGETGAVLVLCGFALHAVACALLLQPVEWHLKKTDEKEAEDQTLVKQKEEDEKKDKESGYFSNISKIKSFSVFSSQYLYNEDDPNTPGYEITDPGIPMLVRANDGYFSQSRQSRSRVTSRDGSTRASRLPSKKPSMTNLLENRSKKSSTLYLNESKKNSSANLAALAEKEKKENKYREKPKREKSITETHIPESEIEDCPTLKAPQDLKTDEKTEENVLESRSRKSSTLYLTESKKNSSANLAALAEKAKREDRDNYKPKRKKSITETQILESEIEDCPTLKAPQDLKDEEKAVVESIDPEKAKFIQDRAQQHLTSNKSVKSFKMDQYGDTYNNNNHSNVSFKNQEDYDERKYLKDNHSNQSYRTKNRRKSNNFNYESELLKEASLKLEQYLKENEETDIKETTKLLENGQAPENNENNLDDEEIEEKLTFCQKIAMFFDLDLLKDFTFINLMLGITLANFNEINFSILTPFILGDFGMTKSEVAFFMSLLAGVDICVRFCVPMIAGKIGWQNNSFFLFGVICMAMGRIVLAYCQNYTVVLIVAVIIGFGKGLRTVFMALVIPTHVPLEKLPGATGIQLLTAGIVYLSLGPFVGWIKDNASTSVTLHCLNIFTWLTALSWGLEKILAARKLKAKEEQINDTNA